MDTWLLLKTIECGGEMNRALYVLKSRGMDHSNQIREFLLTDDGLQVLDVYLGSDGVLTGSARLSQEGREKAADTSRHEQLASRKRELERKRGIFEARMSMLRGEFEVEAGGAAAEHHRIEPHRRGAAARSRTDDPQPRRRCRPAGKVSRATSRKRGNGHVSRRRPRRAGKRRASR